MTRPTPFAITAALAFCSVSLVPAALGQENPLTQYSSVSNLQLQNPAPEDWLMWRRTYDLSGHSPLTQISSDNVAYLELAWQTPLSQGGNMTTPLVHDGVMFIADTGNRLLALDARTGEQLWVYVHESENFDGRRIGVALHGDKVIVPHNDMTMVALDVRTGAVEWTQTIDTPVENVTGGYYALRSAPVIADGVIVQGVTATAVPQGGFIFGLDLETGAELWRFYTVARPDTPGGETWNDLTLEERSGGSVWIPGSYDADLDLIFFGTAPTYDTAPLLPDLNIAGVSNDALYTNTTLALRPATGELVWHYQHIENDQWDLDWVYERQISELPINGENRKVIFTAGKMALYDVLDAGTGQYLDSLDTGIQNMIASIDPVTGKKALESFAIPNAEQGHLLCPYLLGGRNWQSGAYNTASKMLYLPLSEVCMMGGPLGGESSLLSSGVTLDPQPRLDSDGNFGRLQAIDMNDQQLGWTQRYKTPPATAALSTAGGVIFTGFLDQSFKAIDATTGDTLWETALGHLPSSFPITYAVDGVQYVAIIRGQPSRFIGSLYGIIGNFMSENGETLATPSTDPAILVYALP